MPPRAAIKRMDGQLRCRACYLDGRAETYTYNLRHALLSDADLRAQCARSVFNFDTATRVQKRALFGVPQGAVRVAAMAAMRTCGVPFQVYSQTYGPCEHIFWASCSCEEGLWLDRRLNGYLSSLVCASCSGIVPAATVDHRSCAYCGGDSPDRSCRSCPRAFHDRCYPLMHIWCRQPGSVWLCGQCFMWAAAAWPRPGLISERHSGERTVLQLCVGYPA